MRLALSACATRSRIVTRMATTRLILVGTLFGCEGKVGEMSDYTTSFRDDMHSILFHGGRRCDCNPITGEEL